MVTEALYRRFLWIAECVKAQNLSLEIYNCTQDDLLVNATDDALIREFFCNLAEDSSCVDTGEWATYTGKTKHWYIYSFILIIIQRLLTMDKHATVTRLAGKTIPIHTAH